MGLYCRKRAGAGAGPANDEKKSAIGETEESSVGGISGGGGGSSVDPTFFCFMLCVVLATTSFISHSLSHTYNLYFILLARANLCCINNPNIFSKSTGKSVPRT